MSPFSLVYVDRDMSCTKRPDSDNFALFLPYIPGTMLISLNRDNGALTYGYWVKLVCIHTGMPMFRENPGARRTTIPRSVALG